MRDRALIAVVAVALAARLLFFSFVNPVGWDEKAFYQHSFYDASEYHNQTKEFVKDLDGGLLNPFIAYRYTHKIPAYPAYIAFFYATLGGNAWPVFLSQILLDCATTALVYLITKRLTAMRHAPTIAALIYATDPGTIYYASTLMTETVFIFLVTASTYILTAAEERGWRKTDLAAAGLTLGASTLFKYMGILLPAAFLACMFFSKGFRSLGARRILVAAAVFMAAYAFALAPWQLRNYQVYGHYALTTAAGYNFCHFNAGDAWYVLKESPQPDSFCRVEGAKNPFEKAEANLNAGLSYVLRHPAVYLRLHVDGMYSLFFGRPETIPARIWQLYGDILGGHGLSERGFIQALGGYMTVLVWSEFVFLFAGTVWLIGDSASPYGKMMLVAPIVYFANITGDYGSSILGERYILPLLPFTSIICACGISWAAGRLMRKRPSGRGRRRPVKPRKGALRPSRRGCLSYPRI